MHGQTGDAVRFQQKHKGIPVLGGQYLVRLEDKDGARVVTGTSGKYFTGLDVEEKAQVSVRTAVERATAFARSEPSPDGAGSWTKLTGVDRVVGRGGLAAVE